MTNEEILEIALRQSAEDIGCGYRDFLSERNVIVPFRLGKHARKYLKDEYEFTYRSSLFSMKPILMASEIDDSRPTVIRTYSEKPAFVSVLSGKINTVYDLNEVLDHAE